jgi:hypothetical protein
MLREHLYSSADRTAFGSVVSFLFLARMTLLFAGRKIGEGVCVFALEDE